MVIEKTGLYFGDYLLKCEVQSTMVMKSCIFDNTEIPVANQGSAPPSLLLSPIPSPTFLLPLPPHPTSALSHSRAPPTLLKIQGVQNNLELLQFEVPLEMEVYHKCFAVFNFLELPEF